MFCLRGRILPDMSALCCVCMFTPALPGQRHCEECLPGWLAAHRQGGAVRGEPAAMMVQALVDAAWPQAWRNRYSCNDYQAKAV